MEEKKSAGHLSAVAWSDTDLQLQTEVRYGEDANLTTIMVADGRIVARVTKPWLGNITDEGENKRIRDYHNRLTLALTRLCDKQWITLEDLPRLAERMVGVALKLVTASRSGETFSIMPGAHWVALTDLTGGIKEAAPSVKIVSKWSDELPALVSMLNATAKVFRVGEMHDATLRTAEGFVLAAFGVAEIAAAAVEPGNIVEAMRKLRNLVGPKKE